LNKLLNSSKPEDTTYHLSPHTLIDSLIHKELEALDISSMTPLQALNTLASLKEKIKLGEKQESLNVD